MYLILMLAIASMPAKTFQVLHNQYYPWRSILDKEIKSQRVLCTLPPYPQNGSYVVIDAPNARPGDTFENVSLVQHDDKGDKYEIKFLHCASGHWSESVLAFQSENGYFNTSWCPILCPSSTNTTVPSPTLSKVKYTSEPGTRNTGTCYLPHLLYYVVNMSDAKPGDNFKRVKYYQTIPTDESNIYEIKYMSCDFGTWSKIIFRGADTSIEFYKNWCPFLCSPPFIETSTVSEQENLTETETAENVISTSTIKALHENRSQCELPPYPENGRYVVANKPQAGPGGAFGAVRLDFSCSSNMKLVGNRTVYCFEGVWSDQRPKCIGCGQVKSVSLEDNEDIALAKQVPWHVAVYSKSSTDYELKCGGTIIATNLVVSAAHCFWSDDIGLLEASSFAVAAAKLYPTWNESRDSIVQTSDVAEIQIPPTYRNSQSRFKDDISLLFLTTPFSYNDYVAPVCLDFDLDLDEEQLLDGNVGKIAHWGSADANDGQGIKLRVEPMPYVEINHCVSEASPDFLHYITNDKICAGDTNSTLCERDRGAGLAFKMVDDTKKSEEEVFYLRGLVSVAPTDDNNCNIYPVNMFTDILKHENFLKSNFKKAIW